MITKYKIELLRSQQEYATMLGISQQAINKKVKKGQLKTTKIAGKELIYLPEVVPYKIYTMNEICELIAKDTFKNAKQCRESESDIEFAYTCNIYPVKEVLINVELSFTVWLRENGNVLTIINLENFTYHDQLNDFEICEFYMIELEIELEKQLNDYYENY